MARAKKRTKPVKGRKQKTKKRRGVKVPSKEIIKPIVDKLRGKKGRKKRGEKKKEEIVIPVPVVKKRKKMADEKEAEHGGYCSCIHPLESYDTSGGPRKKYYIVLEEETNAAFGMRAYRKQQYSPCLMNQIIKIATKSNIKFSRKDVERWGDETFFDDGTDEKVEDAKIIRPYDPNTKSYDRMRRRFTYTLESSVVEKFRKSVKTHLYGCYLINHLMREHLRGNLDLSWTEKDQEEAINWSISAPHTPVEHVGDIIPYNPGDPAAIVTHEWSSVLAAQKAAKEAEKTQKKKRKRTISCPYPECGGRASRYVGAEDKKNIYYKCEKCKRTFTRMGMRKEGEK